MCEDTKGLIENKNYSVYKRKKQIGLSHSRDVFDYETKKKPDAKKKKKR